MDEHKYKVGQMVRLIGGMASGRSSDTIYEITRAMPSDGREHSYRVKATHETYERAVREGEIERTLRS